MFTAHVSLDEYEAMHDELIALRARVADLEGIEQRARGVVDDGDPEETPIARYILGEA